MCWRPDCLALRVIVVVVVVVVMQEYDASARSNYTLVAITKQDAYRNKSFEELRLEDMKKGAACQLRAMDSVLSPWICAVLSLCCHWSLLSLYCHQHIVVVLLQEHTVVVHPLPHPRPRPACSAVPVSQPRPRLESPPRHRRSPSVRDPHRRVGVKWPNRGAAP